MNAPHARFEAIGLAKGAGVPVDPVRPLERRRLQCYLGLIVADSLALFAGFTAGGYLYLGPQGLALASTLAQLIFPVFLTIGLYNRAYSLTALEKVGFGIGKAMTALAISAAAVLFIAFYTRSTLDFSRIGFSLGLVLAAATLCWARLQMRGFVAWRCGERVTNELVIDDGGPQLSLTGARRVSMADLDLLPSLTDPLALHRIGLLLRGIDRVVVSCPPERRTLWAMILKGANIAGEVLDDSVAELGAQGARIAGGHGFLRVSVGPLGMRARGLKRLFDLVIAGFGLVLLAPLLLVIAVAILLEDGGPVLFRQRRVGRGNRFFEVYKFRSMRIARTDANGAVSTRRDDQRFTRVGRLIRRTSLDELPQLANVLMGEMSLVGPRPHALGSQAGAKLFWEIDDRYWQRHALKPGMTGLAQVRGLRGSTEREADLEDRLHADLEYLADWSLQRDLAILFATLRVLVHQRAY